MPVKGGSDAVRTLMLRCTQPFNVSGHPAISIPCGRTSDGMPIGAKVTLRGDRMWEFLDRLISIAIPRIRDFRGLNGRAFDGNGNYTLGLTEQLIFPEIDYDKVAKIRGMDITVVTTATTDDAGRRLLLALGFPFERASTAAAS